MSIIEKKEKNLNQLINKLNSLTSTYSQSTYEVEKIITEKNELSRQKNEIEKKNQELMREHKYLKEKIKNLQLEVNKKSELEDKFNEDIEELIDLGYLKRDELILGQWKSGIPLYSKYQKNQYDVLNLIDDKDEKLYYKLLLDRCLNIT